MANPTRDTTAGRVYNDLRNLARRNSRSTDVVRQVTAFADTLLNGDAVNLTWSAATLTWS
ncbi:hypothetical protein ACFYWO_20475 [Streptomyces sp. NPDC002932]|uniref:hypothetical protein n=1 Tax=Streptomyces sp. NPDC002932 TaxID=3364672 RepID=UPI00369A5E77